MHQDGVLSTFEPQDLAHMQRLFSAACAELGIDGRGEAVNDLAARVFKLYQQGVRDESDLRSYLHG